MDLIPQKREQILTLDQPAGNSTSGEQPPKDPPAKLVKLNQEIDNIIGLFAQTKKVPWTASFEVRPRKDNLKGPTNNISQSFCYALLRLSKEKGVSIDNNTIEGTISRNAHSTEKKHLSLIMANGLEQSKVGQEAEQPEEVTNLSMVPSDFQAQLTENNPTLFLIIVRDKDDAQYQVIEKINSQTGPKLYWENGESGGFPYRLPVAVKAYLVLGKVKQTTKNVTEVREINGSLTNVTVSVTTESVTGQGTGVQSLQIAQLGKVLRLPADTGTYDSQVDASYDDKTGVLKEVKTISKSLDPTTFDSLLNSAKESASAISQSIKDSKQADSEKDALQRELDILDLKVKIKAAKDTLGIE